MRSSATLTVVPGGAGEWVLVGELDVATAPLVREAVSAARGDVVMECTGVTFVDAAGINLFVELHRLCASRGSTLTIVDPSPFVVRLLALTGVDGVIHVRFERREP